MRVVADLHLHSKYSRATSEGLNIPNMSKWSKIKGVDVLATGDFTHPLWIKELKEKLEAKDGLYCYENSTFILTSEVSNVFQVGAKTKKIHNLLISPSLEVAEQINERLGKFGDLGSDGRPTLKMKASELVETVMEIEKKCMIIAAHCWTPWFGVFGANGGFNTIEECYEDQAKHIHALETGLSSDPGMNWRLSSLDKYTLISNSDSHSVKRMAREANVFDLKALSYDEVYDAIIKKDKKKFKFTYEFFPEEGKYHYDGHRNCNVSLTPKESRRYNKICPVCRKKLTIGVLHRVEELADREEGFVPENNIPFRHIMPLDEILGKALGRGKDTKLVELEYSRLIQAFGNELSVFDADLDSLAKVSGPRIGEAISRVNKGQVKAIPGYDGVYGEIDLFGEIKEKEMKSSQSSLKDYS
ncbi:DNA helicase UvrD [Candidatus Micrarchaeota archaeon]|nr:DNA helicase UvrD [Candidatus Micrarchaeota archaeon]